MTETNETTTFEKVVANPRSLILAAIVLAIGMIAGGYLLGDGLLRAKAADRAVTVRGLAERDVTADLATWTISYSAEGPSLQAVQAEMDRDTETIYAFFREAGFDADALSPSGVNVNEYVRNGQRITSISQRLHFRTDDIEGAERVAERQFELARRGVSVSDGSGMTYTFTGLNEIKPEMIAEATRDARAGAERFAEDSGTNVGSIKTATQGYFSIGARDGEGGYGAGDRPGKKVRVVTTIQFYLD
ncbi:SIMPL domain-containing protein [Sphingomicrobium sediminis]